MPLILFKICILFFNINVCSCVRFLILDAEWLIMDE